MSSVAVSWALRQKTETSLEKLVLTLIADNASSFSKEITYPIASLMQDARCSRSGAHKALRGLVSQGLVSANRKSGWRTLYKLNPPLKVVST